MRKINVYRLMLQFDGNLVTKGKPEKQAKQIIDAINEELTRQFPDACPQLFQDPKEGYIEIEEDEA